MWRVEKEFGTGVRLRAARHLAGYTSVEDLANALNQPGLKATVLRAIEREERPGRFPELREIADCCGLPVEFFTADFSKLASISGEPREIIAARTKTAVERSGQRLDSKPADRPAHEEADPPP
jgi:transcriptional regulator with XRE-family HTH domain